MRLAAAMTLLVAVNGGALAADLRAAPPPLVPIEPTSGVAIFGEATVGVHSVFGKPTGSNDVFFAPYLSLGGKVAFQPAGSRFGAQLDLEYTGLDIGWISPRLDVGGSFGDLRGIAHLTYMATDTLKLGLYGGLQYDYLHLKNNNVGTFGYLSLRTGAEAVYAATSQTTWFGHLGYIDPFWAHGDGSSSSDSSNVVWGAQIGGGIDHRLDRNWKIGGSLEYSWMTARGDGDLGLLDLTGKVDYSPDTLPGTFGLDLAWRPVFVSEQGGGRTTENSFGVALRWVYRFGAPETSASTTLMRY